MEINRSKKAIFHRIFSVNKYIFKRKENNQMSKFEKVSFKQFREGVNDCLAHATADEVLKEMYDDLQLPKRATKGSAGYDFHMPYGVTLKPGQTEKIPTGVRCRIDDGFFLAGFPRSGLGFKYRLQLDNTVGIIDSDYYYSDNEGHIFFKITNDSRENKTLELKKGDRFAQGILIPFGIVEDDNADGIRNGGMGSTSKN